MVAAAAVTATEVAVVAEQMVEMAGAAVPMAMLRTEVMVVVGAVTMGYGSGQGVVGEGGGDAESGGAAVVHASSAPPRR